MKTLVDRRLVQEVDRFGLRYACESCCYFAADSQLAEAEQRCALGYPNHEHRAARLELGRELVFCKEFELA